MQDKINILTGIEMAVNSAFSLSFDHANKDWTFYKNKTIIKILPTFQFFFFLPFNTELGNTFNEF